LTEDFRCPEPRFPVRRPLKEFRFGRDRGQFVAILWTSIGQSFHPHFFRKAPLRRKPVSDEARVHAPEFWKRSRNSHAVSVVPNLVSESELSGFGGKRRKDLSVHKNLMAGAVVGNWIPRSDGIVEVVEMPK
jgi:hypothetical protein